MKMEQPAKREPRTEEQQREKIISSFYRDGELLSIPTKAAKRDIVLAFLAEELFEQGRVYTEREVNAKLMFVFSDHCRLRRELVDAGLLERERDGSEYRVGERSER